MAAPLETPVGTPFGIDDYGTTLYGHEHLQKYAVKVKTHIAIMGEKKRMLHTKYRIKARYNGTEDNIEDMYCYASYRFMAMGCFDGPLFPYRSKQEGVEGG